VPVCIIQRKSECDGAHGYLQARSGCSRVFRGCVPQGPAITRPKVPKTRIVNWNAGAKQNSSTNVITITATGSEQPVISAHEVMLRTVATLKSARDSEEQGIMQGGSHA
jgi:hypothetical protein